MRRRVGLAVLAVLVAFLSFLGWLLAHRSRLGRPSPLESQWHTEEEWLVGSVVRDVAEMAWFASVGPRSIADKVAVTVRHPVSSAHPAQVLVVLAPGIQVDRELPLTTSVWSPHEYEELSKALFDAAGAKADPPSRETGPDFVLTSLSDLQPAVIEQANARVSDALASRFTDPALHESAALLMAAFALREAAGTYSDSRAALCRITAHLAVAKVLGGGRPPGLEGRFAEAALLVLSGRGADARTALDELDRRADPTAGAHSWRIALRVRLTGDTRRVAPRTLVERREIYRALMRTTAEGAALPAAEELAQEDMADWWRLANESGWSVQTGNAFLEHALEQELSEMHEVWRLARRLPFEDSWLVPALNERADRCITRAGPRAIGWGTWAAFFQRHILYCLWVKNDHLRGHLGLPDRAKREFQNEGLRFSGLTLYPILEASVDRAAGSRTQSLRSLVSLAARRPELLNAAYFMWASKLTRYRSMLAGTPDPRLWFAPVLPRGTTFDAARRMGADLLPRTEAGLRPLHAISPDDQSLTFALVRSLKTAGGHPDLAEAERLLGPRLDYDIGALGLLAELTPNDLAALSGIFERQCSRSPQLCFRWAHSLVEAGDREGAARAYQRGMDSSLDEVLASNESRWLVNYYLDVGARDRAKAIAEQAAATGSAAGMVSMSRYLERTGAPEKAEAWLQRRIERYPDHPRTNRERENTRDGAQLRDELIGFYHRMALREQRRRYEQGFADLTRQDFPKSLEPADAKAFPGRPEDGVFVEKTYPFSERAGLRVGDIIVAVDGIRIRTRRQYYVVRKFSDAPEMILLVYRHPGIIELRARSATRDLSIEMRSHKTGEAIPLPRQP